MLRVRAEPFVGDRAEVYDGRRHLGYITRHPYILTFIIGRDDCPIDVDLEATDEAAAIDEAMQVALGYTSGDEEE